jgi:hypothetical protein
MSPSVVWTSFSHRQVEEEEDKRWSQRTRLKREVGEGVRRRWRKGVEREVGEGIVDCALPDLVREIVNETISDIVFRWELTIFTDSYID